MRMLFIVLINAKHQRRNRLANQSGSSLGIVNVRLGQQCPNLGCITKCPGEIGTDFGKATRSVIAENTIVQLIQRDLAISNLAE